MLLTYTVQCHVDAPNGGDDDDKEYLENCATIENMLERLPGYRSHEIEDESED